MASTNKKSNVNIRKSAISIVMRFAKKEIIPMRVFTFHT